MDGLIVVAALLKLSMTVPKKSKKIIPKACKGIAAERDRILAHKFSPK